jgi:hypothetical protein
MVPLPHACLSAQRHFAKRLTLRTPRAAPRCLWSGDAQRPAYTLGGAAPTGEALGRLWRRATATYDGNAIRAIAMRPPVPHVPQPAPPLNPLYACRPRPTTACTRATSENRPKASRRFQSIPAGLPPTPGGGAAPRVLLRRGPLADRSQSRNSEVWDLAAKQPRLWACGTARRGARAGEWAGFKILQGQFQ